MDFSLLILFFICFILKKTQSFNSKCSREPSRKISKYLKNELLPYLDISPNQLSNDCPLNINNDIFFDQENHKSNLNSREWRCEYCNKRFVDEFYLDKHLNNKHPDKLLPANKSICLSDLCPLFGCHKDEYIDSSKKSKVALLEKCTSDSIDIIKSNCFAISNRCFSSNPTSQKKFNSRICESIKCIRGIYQVDSRPNGSFRSYFLRILRYLFVILIIGLTIIYVPLHYFSFNWLGSIFSRGGKDVDFLGKFMKKNSSKNSFWFLQTIITAFTSSFKKKK